jgi:hypothetical protein
MFSAKVRRFASTLEFIRLTAIINGATPSDCYRFYREPLRIALD